MYIKVTEQAACETPSSLIRCRSPDRPHVVVLHFEFERDDDSNLTGCTRFYTDRSRNYLGAVEVAARETDPRSTYPVAFAIAPESQVKAGLVMSYRTIEAASLPQR